MKFYYKSFSIKKIEAEKLTRKRNIFEESTKTKKHLFVSLITTYGIQANEHSIGLIDHVLDLEDLFT